MMRVFVFAIGTVALAQAPTPPPIPEGLWLSRDEGFVVRIESCGDGFCGIAVGAPRDQKKERPDDSCGKTMMKDFKWEAKAGRWEGAMQRPGRPSIGGSLTSNGDTLSLTARVLMVSKKMVFVPFTGSIGANCQIE
jgi:uncharacterized protein (DUF2147 family)